MIPDLASPCSLVGRLEPRTRVLLAPLFALVTVTAQTPAALAGCLGLALMLAACARLPAGPTCRRLLALEGILLAALALLPFTLPGRPVGEVAGLAVSAEGLERAAAILVKANAVTLGTLALLGTLETVALGRALARLGAPERFVALLLFTLRYVPVIGEEYRRLRTAMRARGFDRARGRHAWASYGCLFGMLMVRAVERAERIDAAMRCRGFSGRFPRLDDSRPGALDWGIGAASALAAVLALAPA